MGNVVLIICARPSACLEQIQFPFESGMQKPIYPTLTSRDGVRVEFVLTRLEKVLEREGFN